MEIISSLFGYNYIKDNIKSIYFFLILVPGIIWTLILIVFNLLYLTFFFSLLAHIYYAYSTS